MGKFKSFVLIVATFFGLIGALFILFSWFIAIEYNGDYKRWWNEWIFGAKVILSIVAFGFLTIFIFGKSSKKKV
ncbi:hypothetical protein [Sphingobacterium mizutaii]|uniref:hypothetical protein n=1 Tax=Sphingobacterium mizutaii TaxID=1010 RepID=UPI0028A98A64|nr:hypothetical protein [Sphingobacterium mizutaii]